MLPKNILKIKEKARKNQETKTVVDFSGHNHHGPITGALWTKYTLERG
jgi:hypothetical protein